MCVCVLGKVAEEGGGRGEGGIGVGVLTVAFLLIH